MNCINLLQSITYQMNKLNKISDELPIKQLQYIGYDAVVKKHDSVVEQYNKLIDQYNNLKQIMEELENKYNCIKKIVET
jgi:hypothetical protein